MKKKGCQGDIKCRFYDEPKAIHHLFFTCSAKYMWSIVSKTIGASNRSGNFSQYFAWIARFYPVKTKLHVVGVAALC
jgi:hypothetical protein